MAKNTKVETETAETINLGEFINQLGISAPTWRNHPEWREFLEKQDGVVFEARKSSIPAHLVKVLADEFSISPRISEARTRGPRKAQKRAPGINYSALSVAELLEHMEQERAVLADGDDYQTQIQEMEVALKDLRGKQEHVKGASERLLAIQKALTERQASLDAEADRIAQEKALLEGMNA